MYTCFTGWFEGGYKGEILEWDVISILWTKWEAAVLSDDLTAYVGKHAHGYKSVHGGYGGRIVGDWILVGCSKSSFLNHFTMELPLKWIIPTVTTTQGKSSGIVLYAELNMEFNFLSRGIYKLPRYICIILLTYAVHFLSTIRKPWLCGGRWKRVWKPTICHLCLYVISRSVSSNCSNLLFSLIGTAYNS